MTRLRASSTNPGVFVIFLHVVLSVHQLMLKLDSYYATYLIKIVNCFKFNVLALYRVLNTVYSLKVGHAIKWVTL